jgi:hypothetical protein
MCIYGWVVASEEAQTVKTIMGCGLWETESRLVEQLWLLRKIFFNEFYMYPWSPHVNHQLIFLWFFSCTFLPQGWCRGRRQEGRHRRPPGYQQGAMRELASALADWWRGVGPWPTYQQMGIIHIWCAWETDGRGTDLWRAWDIEGMASATRLVGGGRAHGVWHANWQERAPVVRPAGAAECEGRWSAKREAERKVLTEEGRLSRRRNVTRA